MALRDEQADILGGPILQRPEYGLFSIFSRYHFVFKSVTFFGLGLLVWIVCVRGLEHLKKHRELRYRKAMRRKHGIPDSDCRPFAVAYAAAKRAHLEREALDQKRTANYVSHHNLPAVDQRTDAQNDARGLRRRVPETTVQLHDYQLPGKHTTAYDSKRPEVHSLNFVPRYIPDPCRRLTVPESFPVEKLPVRHARKKDSVPNISNNEESRKRTFEDESDVEHETIKKSRVDGDELIDGDEQADWYDQYADLPPRRVSKESLDPQPADYYMFMNSQKRSKHAGGFRDEGHEPADEAMDRIHEDEVTDPKAVARGKKRDRTEAGSTFGGDDDDDTRNGRISHHRKRRTILRRGMEVPARGQKRDREVESPESEDEGAGSETSRRGAQSSTKKKRGKKAASDEVSEISVEDPRVSRDPLCSGRRVGDEWKADGAQYKVGLKGERLRLALVRKARNKYHMPQDSQHPDRSAALEIYVETWMTDEQYRQAETGRELAWQEAPRESNGLKAPDALDLPTKNGKSLLWDSVKGSPARRPFHQFMPTGASARINPFEQWQSQPTLRRRVASASTIISSVLPGIADSPTRPGFRGFSKWEKQDREAEALVRIRAKIEEQKKTQVPPQKPAEIPASLTAPELAIKSLSVPTITLTPAPVAAAEGDPDNDIPQSKSNATTSFFKTTHSTSDSIKSTAATGSTTITGFQLPSISMPTSTLSMLYPSAPTAPAITSSAASHSPFAFAKPPQVPLSISTPMSSSAMPSLFEKASTITPFASAPSSSAPDAAAQRPQPHPPSTGSASKPIVSSFMRPDTSSSISPPAVAVPPATKSQTPNFGVISNSPSPVILGSTPAAAKAEAPAPAPVPTSATTASESSQPTIPIFSFSGAPSTITLPTSSVTPTSATPTPKFSFGQPPTTSMFTPSPDLVSGTSYQSKPTFKFSPTPPDSSPKVLAADASKKSAIPVSVANITTGSNESVKPSPFGTTSTFGSSTLNLPSASLTNFLGKAVTADGSSSTSTLLRPTLAPASTTTFNLLSSTPTGAPAPGNTSMFSFGGTNSRLKFAEESKPAPLFGGVVGGSTPMPSFGNSTETKPMTIAFATSAESSSQLPSVFGSSAETSKPSSVFGVTAEGSGSTPASSGTVENKFTSGSTIESSKSPNATDTSKPASVLGATTSGPPSATSTFTFGKDGASTNASTSMGTQPKPAAFFTFGAPSGVTGSMFGQTSVTSSDGSQSMFGRPPSVTPSTFGAVGTGGSTSPSTFAFSKPAAQNHKQEQ